jgi:hypothetical protein
MLLPHSNENEVFALLLQLYCAEIYKIRFVRKAPLHTASLLNMRISQESRVIDCIVISSHIQLALLVHRISNLSARLQVFFTTSICACQKYNFCCPSRSTWLVVRYCAAEKINLCIIFDLSQRQRARQGIR